MFSEKSLTPPGSSDLRTTLTSIAECPVCREPFTVGDRKPKLMMQCGHTMCLQCGLDYCRIKVALTPGGCITCPVCRRRVKIPQGGFQALPNNLTMMKLLDVRDVLARSDSLAELDSALDMADEMIGWENKSATNRPLCRLFDPHS